MIADARAILLPCRVLAAASVDAVLKSLNKIDIPLASKLATIAGPKNARSADKMRVSGGAAEGIRTPDPRITNALLYQLSYRGL